MEQQKRNNKTKLVDEVIKGDKGYGAIAASSSTQRDETMSNSIMSNFSIQEIKKKNEEGKQQTRRQKIVELREKKFNEMYSKFNFPK